MSGASLHRVTSWDEWAVRRPESEVVHLDSAAAGRASSATLEAVIAHLHREVEVGGYVAEEELAPAIVTLRARLAELIGVDMAGLGLTASARTGLRLLLEQWPLPTGMVAVARSEWGPNLQLFADRGHQLQQLPVDESGHLDLDACAAELRRQRPVLVHLDASSAHRGLRQPVTEMTRLCRELDIPVWVDAAQATGQTTDLHGDAVYGNSRKWFAGPRGVGYLAVDRASWDRLSVPARPDVPLDLPPVELMTVGEANIAGRAGFAVAVTEYVEDGPELVAARLDEVGKLTRAALGETRGWEVLPGQTGPITAIRPTAGQDVLLERARLLADHHILTTATLPWRAPLEPIDGWLRISPHVDLTAEQLELLVRALGNA